MPGTGPGDLQTLMEELLQASIDALDTIPTFDPALGGAPDRTYVNAGQPAFDCCDQLTVNAGRITEAPTEPGLRAGTKHRLDYRINHVAAQISITRCLDNPPADLPPSPTALQALAEQTNADAWALWNHLWNLARSGDLVTICDEVFFDALTPVQPSGGCAGWVLSLRAELEGYEE